MTTTMNFAIVGYGMISAIHARSIQELPGANLIAVYGHNRERAQAFAANYGAAAYDDYERMLENADIDIVCILTPSGSHAELGIAAAKAGKHVIVEKPIAITLESADRLIESCKVNNVKLCCISQHRYDHAIIALKNAVDSGQLGQLNFGASHTKWYRTQAYYDNNEWRGTWALDGGGALMNQSVHYIDLLQYIMGPVDEVFAYCATRAHAGIEVEDVGAATVKFKSGAIGLIEGNTSAYPGFSTRLDIYGSDGGVIIENDEVKEWKLRNEGLYEPPKTKVESIVGASRADISHHSHKLQIADFMKAIRTRQEPLVNGLEGRKTLQIVLSLYESARTGKPIQIK
ncbi:Gfo/Idh/MocA family protein [Paenibacillus sp. R14(2021)]|uniref:Gfo/Idh/MocA family protein n=1 Tax=Paenibacillus sp. R14(2021) TaxID=2859228 RepID=UPI001C615AD7|nr:Gfo/Idh/MocA family oxidoreductase [Paenibacillus sp. R14(2021)]